MADNPNDWSIVYGMLTTFVVILAWLAWFLTEDNPPVKRRALRIGITVGVLIACLIAGAEWWLFNYAYAPVGGFMLLPSVVMGALAAWLAGRATFRALGGNLEDENSDPQHPPSIEGETRENQSAIWCRLRDLPHMRETLKGDLINLATADMISWGQYKGERCIMLNLGGKTEMTGARYETLTRYLAVQEGMARLLFGEGAGK